VDVVHKKHDGQIGVLGVLVAATFGLLASGCGGTLYAVTANSASSKLEEARALGAERYAAYEYWMAHEHHQKAMEEAAAADYGDALDFAETAEQYADKATKLAREAHEGAGR
jgi:hypothetical protein